MTNSTSGLRWGLFGAARIARALIPAIRASGGAVDIVGVRDPASDHAREFARTWEIPHLGTYQDVVDAGIDFVYNALPGSLHLPWSKAAMQAGKHALTEKTLAMNALEAAEFARVSQASGSLSLEAFAYRFQPHIARIREIVASGELGELRLYQGQFGFTLSNPDDFRWHPELGGGSMFDVGCYPLNLMRLLLGEPQSASARVRWSGEHPGTGIDLGVSAVMDYGSALASVSAAFDWSGRPHLSLIGTAGQLDMADPFASNNRSPLTLRVGERTETFAPSDGYAQMVAHFQRAASAQEALRFLPDDAVKQAELIDALLASGRQEA
ncbi:Gfo/Idh/MocA family oxidoreductase [Deinococcus sp.]|uniref:Gfo/Idh/MocA family protein n=1 Tax=Deinococcus sp. TaxID=47478 RepID=UPI0025DA02EA|nr:Gfo/Idh/MocA family oxidoreductase [Deinococcus sp.]